MTPVTDLNGSYIRDMLILFTVCVPSKPAEFIIDSTGNPIVYLLTDCN